MLNATAVFLLAQSVVAVGQAPTSSGPSFPDMVSDVSKSLRATFQPAPQQPGPPAPDKGLRPRLLGGVMLGKFELGSDFNGFQVTGGLFRRGFQNRHFEGAGDISFGRGGLGSFEVDGEELFDASVTFIEGAGFFFYNFTGVSETLVPFAGGGLTIGRYSINLDVQIISASLKKTYASPIIAGGIEIPRPGGKTFRLEARVGEFFAILAGFSF